MATTRNAGGNTMGTSRPLVLVALENVSIVGQRFSRCLLTVKTGSSRQRNEFRRAITALGLSVIVAHNHVDADIANDEVAVHEALRHAAHWGHTTVFDVSGLDGAIATLRQGASYIVSVESVMDTRVPVTGSGAGAEKLKKPLTTMQEHRKQVGKDMAKEEARLSRPKAASAFEPFVKPQDEAECPLRSQMLAYRDSQAE